MLSWIKLFYNTYLFTIVAQCGNILFRNLPEGKMPEMLDKLKKIDEKFAALEHRMASPEVYTDPETYAKLAREQKELLPVVTAYREYAGCESDMESARLLLGDPEMGELAREEYDAAREKLAELEQRIRVLLLPRDPNDEKSVIVEIRGGVGGEESALFAAALYRMYTMYADTKGWKTEIANINQTELGGIKEVSFILEGDGAYSRLKFESGVHRVQRVPETEAQGRIQTSTATVAVLPEMDEMEFSINPADLQIDTFRSTGAGGQKVNKTESAIRITHLPTGTVVECQDERSQYKNKDRAMKILASRLYEAEREKRDAAVAAERKSQVGTGMRNERIRTYNFPQGRVTDHRIGITLYKIDAIMDGALDELIDALITADQADKLKADAAE
jgi:peptide chain release factor 1